MVLGLVVAGAVIVAMQIPLLHRPALVRVTLDVATAPSGDPVGAPALAWPAVGSAAIDIPSLGVLETHDDAVVPIASLTKMMTAYVALQREPLTIGQSGPCHVVTIDDVTTYQEMLALDESSVAVEPGERLCEVDLLEGLLVHSAGNYAVMLADMVAGSTEEFVALMNAEAATLGLSGTHYGDVTGYSSLSVSTARDQALLAQRLMRLAVVRSIVVQPSVKLPIVGTVSSFTPDVGVDDVIGVKSGRTAQAGGCDVMAMTFHDGAATRVLYAVVLGQQGGNLLGPAGVAALALADSALNQRLHLTFEKGRPIGEIVWDGRRVAFGLSTRHEVWWWPGEGRPRVRVSVRRPTSSIRRGEVVGRLVVIGVHRGAYVLRALGDLAPPTLLERLR
jgi:D-alanyl-D-alanine carboxypeptidase (penicillin-binding protein 5/6)